jgi:Flp pilus assembly protein TadD
MRSLVRAVAVAALCAGLGACGGGKPSTTTAANAPKKETRVNLAKPAIQALVEGAAFAKIYLKEGDTTGAKDKAIAKLKTAISIDGRLWEAHYDLGLVYARSGELAKAETELASASADAPDDEGVAIALCEVRRRRGEGKLAAEGLETYCRLHPNALDARARLVVVLREAGRPDDAIAHARFLLARRPLDDATRAELALAHLAKGERDVAELLVAQALKQNPNSAPAWRAEGLIALQKGDDAEAFRAFEKAAQLDPTDTTARMNMGAVLLRAGAFKEAEAAFRAALANAPNDLEAMLGLAVALRSQKRLDEAKAAYEKVLAIQPHNLPAIFDLGVLYADHLKDNTKAKQLFKEVVDEAPSGSPIKADAERYLKEMGDTGAPTPPPAPPPAKPPVKK